MKWQNEMNIALIFAGGVGVRMKRSGLPKQFLDLDGKPILIRTIEKYSMCDDVDIIIVVCHKDFTELLRELIDRYQLKKIKKIVEGGKTGQESIFNGLSYIETQIKAGGLANDSIVLLHDGVRPFISQELIKESIRLAREKGNCIVASQAIETIAECQDKAITKILKRRDCLLLKAPQTFIFKDIYRIHCKAINDGCLDFVDSAEMMLAYGYKLNYMLCEPTNIKITTPIDFFAAKGILKDEVMKHVYGL